MAISTNKCEKFGAFLSMYAHKNGLAVPSSPLSVPVVSPQDPWQISEDFLSPSTDFNEDETTHTGDQAEGRSEDTGVEGNEN